MFSIGDKKIQTDLSTVMKRQLEVLYRKYTTKYFGTSSITNGLIKFEEDGNSKSLRCLGTAYIHRKHLLTRVTACLSLLARHKELSFLNRIFTGDKKWISYNNVVRKK